MQEIPQPSEAAPSAAGVTPSSSDEVQASEPTGESAPVSAEQSVTEVRRMVYCNR